MVDGFVVIQERDFDSSVLQEALQGDDRDCGAICAFVGLVRRDREGANLQSMVLEHYEGMTQSSIEHIIERAGQRWDINCAGVVHRVGRLLPGDQIVWVGVSATHRGQAFSACEFIMDFLKTEAPLWKKEIGECGEKWVDAKSADGRRLDRWAEP